MRIIKEGGNRPLDEDEAAFLDECEAQEEARRLQRRKEHEDDMVAYRLCMAERERAIANDQEIGPGVTRTMAIAEEAGRIAASAAAGAAASTSGKRTRGLEGIMRVRRKKPSISQESDTAAAPAIELPKERSHIEEHGADNDGAHAGSAGNAQAGNALQALLSSYDSDSDD